VAASMNNHYTQIPDFFEKARSF